MGNNLGIFWLRKDFRLLRNDALSFASQNHDSVVAVYIFKKSEFEKKREAQRWWIYRSLKSFEEELSKYNINLELIISENYQSALSKILEKKNRSIYWNKIYEPKYLSFDNKFSDLLEKKEVEYKIFKGNILNEYLDVKKSDGTPFKVFTPFWKNAEPIYLNKGFSKKNLVKKK